MAKRIRLQFDLSEESIAKLDDLSNKIGAKSKGETIGVAIRLLDKLVAWQEAGEEIYVENSKQQTRRRIEFPLLNSKLAIRKEESRGEPMCSSCHRCISDSPAGGCKTPKVLNLMINSMYESPDLKQQHPQIYEQIFGGQGTQVYINGVQVFDVLSASTSSTGDKEYNPPWIDFVLFKDGTVKIGDIQIDVDGVCSSDILVPLDTGSKNKPNG